MNFNSQEMQVIEEAFGQILQQLRKERGLSQEKLALISGYHRTYISLLERGQKSPSLRSIFRLAAALEIQPAFFFEQLQNKFHKS